MHRRHKYDIIVVLAVVGLSVSLYLAVSEAMGITVPCGLTRGCDTVLQSRYSQLLNIPLPWWGIAFYGGVVVASLLANHYRMFRRVLTWLLGAGALAALAFLALQFFVIRSVCQYCLVTDLLSIVLFLWDLNIEHRNPALPVPSGPAA